LAGNAIAIAWKEKPIMDIITMLNLTARRGRQIRKEHEMDDTQKVFLLEQTIASLIREKGEEIARLTARVAALEEVAKYAIECDDANKWRSRQVDAIASKARAALKKEE
jgi:hypothetical protein